jgi:hypothetical protein
MDHSQDRQNEFDQAQITELLCGREFACQGLALISSYGKTKAQHLETPCVCGIENYKTERAFPDAGRSSTAAAVFQIFKDPFS